MSLMSLTAVELAKKIKAGETTAVEAAKDALAQIKEKEESIHSYVTVLDEAQILEKAGEVQKKIQAGELTGPLAGVPVAIKDNMCTEGILTTCSSKILGNFVPTYSSEAVKKLEEAGVVLIGKTNMDEFAMGSTTETSAYGVTRNPYNTDHVPGGSSGGSCAAVAAGFRYRWFHPPAKFFLWRYRHQADLRNRISLRSDRLRFFSGSDRTGCQRCDRLCHNPGSHFIL